MILYDLTREPKVVFWMFLVSRFLFCIAFHMPPIQSYLISRIFASKVMIMVHGSCLMAQQWWGPAQAPGPPIYIYKGGKIEGNKCISIRSRLTLYRGVYMGPWVRGSGHRFSFPVRWTRSWLGEGLPRSFTWEASEADVAEDYCAEVWGVVWISETRTWRNAWYE